MFIFFSVFCHFCNQTTFKLSLNCSRNIHCFALINEQSCYQFGTVFKSQISLIFSQFTILTIASCIQAKRPNELPHLNLERNIPQLTRNKKRNISRELSQSGQISDFLSSVGRISKIIVPTFEENDGIFVLLVIFFSPDKFLFFK